MLPLQQLRKEQLVKTNVPSAWLSYLGIIIIVRYTIVVVYQQDEDAVHILESV